MFGYVMPDKPEMKIKEFELFRAYYCGVCKSMGRNFGVLSRFALNYDSVFLGLFLSSVNKRKAVIRKEACFANPFKKKFIARDNKYIDYAADINVILTYYKLRDNWDDEKNIPSLLGSGAFSRGYKKAKKRNPDIEAAIGKSIKELSDLEKQKCCSMDKAAEPFALMMADILSSGYEGAKKSVKDSLSWAGYNMGKWIYLIDAYDDIKKDAKSNSYNPLILQFDYKPEQDIEEFKTSIKEHVSFNLIHTMSQVANTVELLDIDNKGIIENIAYLGMYKKTEQIMHNCIDNKCKNS